MSSNERNTKKTFNNYKKTEKFVPNFKKRLPTWKQIENESKDLLDSYESVRIPLDNCFILFEFSLFLKYFR